MKRYILLTLLLVFGSAATVAQGVDSLATRSTGQLWEDGNAAFIAGQYPLSAATYEAILSKGEHSAKLYYNLGNAYFEQNQLGKAILNFTRAQNYNPTDEDINYNLALATARTKDKIEPVPEFFLQGWIRSAGYLLSGDGWSVVALALGLLVFTCVILWLVSSRMRLRKLGFAGAIVGSILFVVAIAYAQTALSRQKAQDSAIVMNTAAPVKSSPSDGGKDIFVLHEGTSVQVLQTVGTWSEIRIEDGNKGWIASSAIEQI
ncbi:MAG: tetratricopeptide repeat protein [Mucinivorans sp.]